MYFIIKIFCFVTFIVCIEIENINAQTIRELTSSNLESAVGFSEMSGIFHKNPVLLDNIESYKIFSSYSPSRFGIKELSPAVFSGAFRISNQFVGGLSIAGMGNELYNEYSLAFSTSYSDTGHFIIGAVFDYSQIKIKDNSLRNTLFLNVGGRIIITESLSAGFYWQNMNNSAYTIGNEVYYSLVVIGMGYVLPEGFSVDLDAKIAYNDNSGISAAVKYNYDDIIQCRIAASTEPDIIEAALSISPYGGVDIGVSTSYHTYLGFSRRFSIAFQPL